MTTPRLIATDLDGTLLRPDHTVSARTAAALRAARDAGVTVAAVTARPPRVLDELPRLAALCDLAVCANGALVYDPAERRLLDARPLTTASARAASAALTAVIPAVTFAVETGFEVVAESAYVRVDTVGDERRIVPGLDDVWSAAAPIVKLLAHVAGGDADAMLAAALPAVPGDVVVSHSGGSGLLEISAAGVTKAGALAAVCAARGIHAEEVVAFGDMPNDLPMLTWAGRAYAMGDGHPDVLAAIADHTAGCREDGVAVVVERLLAETCAAPGGA